MKPFNQVTFTSTPNYCELAIESKDNLYIARFWKNGDRELAHNCVKVAVFPQSKLVPVLQSAITKHAANIETYMNCKDTAEGSKLYWAIQNNLQGLGSDNAYEVQS